MKILKYLNNNVNNLLKLSWSFLECYFSNLLSHLSIKVEQGE